MVLFHGPTGTGKTFGMKMLAAKKKEALDLANCGIAGEEQLGDGTL